MSAPTSPEPWPPAVELAGTHARLVLLSQAHRADLEEAVGEGELWRLWFTNVPAAEDMAANIDERLAMRARGAMLPFAVVDTRSDRAVGMTTYMNIDAENRRVEIGSTWYRRAVQRTAINTECKFLLLSHAFETLRCIAVEFRTHRFNQASRQAIERLGAQLDGILRNHSFSRNGALRDTCVYSILATEWPAVKGHLAWQLERPRAATAL